MAWAVRTVARGAVIQPAFSKSDPRLADDARERQHVVSNIKLHEWQVEKALAISTGHMPSAEPDFGDVRSLEYDEGYIVFITEPEASNEDELPDWLRPIMQFAYENDFSMIRFDRDALEVDEFKNYDW
jgi:hypothetical protein